MLCGPPVDVVRDSRAAHGHTVWAAGGVALDSALLLIHQWSIYPPPPPHVLQSLKPPNTFYIWKLAQDMGATRRIKTEICFSLAHAILWQRKDAQQASCQWRHRDVTVEGYRCTFSRHIRFHFEKLTSQVNSLVLHFGTQSLHNVKPAHSPTDFFIRFR
jgi:hypothetical protein